MQPMRTLFLALSHSQRLRSVATRFGPARSMARRFVAGESLDEAIKAVAALNLQGVRATLDHRGENVVSETEARDGTHQVLDLIEAIAESGVQASVSVKLTQLGLDLSPALAAENLERIVERAAQVGRFVRIDMESSDYTQVTLDLFEGLWSRYKNVGIVIQSYLHRSASDVARLVELGAPVRLVKGAYNEPPGVAFAEKADTDKSFVQLAEQLLGVEAQANGVYAAGSNCITSDSSDQRNGVYFYQLTAVLFLIQPATMPSSICLFSYCFLSSCLSVHRVWSCFETLPSIPTISYT